eukprot:g2560.t1
MTKGSTSQTSTNVPRGGRGGIPTGATSTSGGAGLRRRTGRSTTGGGGGGGSGSMSRVSQSVMNFYTDDSPGIKIPPFVVVVLSLCFIGFVTLLHVVGKIRGA